MVKAETIAVVDYGSGNLTSAARALYRASVEVGKVCEIIVTSDPDTVVHARRIVLPGQGAYADCAQGLRSVSGMLPAIRAAIRSGTPFLGICVGMQLLAERGLEHGVTEGFGLVRGEIAHMATSAASGLRMPHVGWNDLQLTHAAHPLLDGIADGAHAYFIHSFALQKSDPGEVLAVTSYGGAVVAMVAAQNVAGTQFHVEKSQDVGLRMLGNFIRWRP